MLRLVISLFALLGVLSVIWYLLGFSYLEHSLSKMLDMKLFILLMTDLYWLSLTLLSRAEHWNPTARILFLYFFQIFPLRAASVGQSLRCIRGGDTFLDGSPSPRVRWVGARGVEIDFSINGARSVSRDVMLRSTDHTGQVSVDLNIVK